VELVLTKYWSFCHLFLVFYQFAYGCNPWACNSFAFSIKYSMLLLFFFMCWSYQHYKVLKPLFTCLKEEIFRRHLPEVYHRQWQSFGIAFLAAPMIVENNIEPLSHLLKNSFGIPSSCSIVFHLIFSSKIRIIMSPEIKTHIL